jgi:hypothetical protein
MKLSERIAVLQAAMAVYGDTEVLRFDMEEGYCETFTEPVVMRQVGDHVVSEQEYQSRFVDYARRQEIVDMLPEHWETIGEELRGSWKSYENFVNTLMQGVLYNDKIVEGYPTAPVVLVI